MKHHEWSQDKNEELKKTRSISFERVIVAMENGRILDIIENPASKYKGQKIYVIEIDGYVYGVPYVESEHAIFLKTIIPSRKLTKKYLKAEEEIND